jgi:2-aminoadipate transaminase
VGLDQTTQLSLRPQIIELGVGQPDPRLLPGDCMRAATAAMLAAGWEPLAYGANAGPENLLSQLALRIAQSEREPSLSEMIVTGGNSQALDELCTLLAQPGDAVLVEAPSYNFALQILRDHRLQLVTVPVDENGLVPDAVDDVLRTLHEKGTRPAFLYTIPTFHNPTGVSLTLPRRRQLLAIAASNDLWVVEDDVYRDLVYSGSAPPSLWTLDDAESVIRLGTFSKVLAPGVRVGWMTAPREIIRQLVGGGLRMSGGGPSHFAAMAVAEFMAADRFEPHVENLRTSYRGRRDALSAALDDLLPEAQHQRPAGGYFVWVRLPPPLDTEELLPIAEEAGVAYVPGRRFFTGGGSNHCLRLSFSMYSPEKLRDGVLRLRTALDKAGARHR